MLPARAARPPTAGPHQSAASVIMNLGKKAIGNGMPPKTLLTTYQVPAELTKAGRHAEQQRFAQHERENLQRPKAEHLQHGHFHAPLADADADGVGDHQRERDQSRGHEQESHAPQQIAIGVQKGAMPDEAVSHFTDGLE